MHPIISRTLSATCAIMFLAVAANAQTVLSLDDAIKIALSENTAVKVADKEIQRSEYARKGTYASLFPQINGTASFQRTIKKQVMYMGGNDSSSGAGDMFSGILDPIMYHIQQLYAGTGVTYIPYVAPETDASSASGGIEVGRANTYNAGISAAMPLVNAQLWESIKISGDAVELAVEKARESRLSTITQVKQAYFSILLAKEAFGVYKEVYENAVANFDRTEKRYNVQKASELDYTRAKAAVANAIPNVYNAESSVILALWQLKAVMGIDLDEDIDVSGTLSDFAAHMFYDIHENDDVSLDRNSTIRQLSIQADQLASAVRVQKYAYLPTLALNFSYSYNAMANDFKFSEYNWTPYSFVGLSLSIPIFSGGKRRADVRQAVIQQEELDLQKLNAERQLRIGIRQYLQTMETNMKSYNSAQDAVATAQKAYDIAAKSYDVGRSTLTDLNDAQLALTQSRLNVSQSIYNFVIAKAHLEETIGFDFTE